MTVAGGSLFIIRLRDILLKPFAVSLYATLPVLRLEISPTMLGFKVSKRFRCGSERTRLPRLTEGNQQNQF